jgi:hypothetical protein
MANAGEKPESGTLSTNAFILSSARSALARERGIELRALGGGEGGVMNLAQIRLEGQVLDLGQAIDSWTSRAGGKYVGRPSPFSDQT